MSYPAKIIRYVILLVLILSLTDCASSKKDSYTAKRKKATSHINTSQLGRNKYYFSPEYQKKLSKNYKKKR